MNLNQKKLLGDYGVPVVREIVAKDIEDAVQAGESLGFPIVLKGHGEKLPIKVATDSCGWSFPAQMT